MNKKPLLLFLFVVLILLAFTSHNNSGFFSKASVDTITPVVFHAKDHKAKSVVSANGIITLTTGLYNDFYQADSINKTGYLYVEARLGKLLNNTAQRIPLNISIVIDRSGSMEGIKMGYAKKAAKGIIDQLNAGDIVSIVMYDTYVDTVQSPIHVADKEKIKAKIDKIIPRASTNLWGGAEQGYQYVQKNYKPGYINRVLLISDGNANTGLTDSAAIHLKVQKYKDDGISISTFGVGLDYNETLMTDMAETGAGNYYFIDAPEKLTAIFKNELSGLLNVAAQNAELRIKLPQGIKIESGYPFQFQQSGDEIVVTLRDLSSDETKAILFSFHLDNRSNSALKFTTELIYTDAADGKEKTMSNDNVWSPTKNADVYLTHFNKQVIEQTILFSANEKLEMAMNLMEKKNFSEAQKYLEQNATYLKAQSIYVNNNPALLKMDSLNSSYSAQYRTALAINADSVKKIQKAIRAVNYQLRNKKQ